MTTVWLRRTCLVVLGATLACSGREPPFYDPRLVLSAGALCDSMRLFGVNLDRPTSKFVVGQFEFDSLTLLQGLRDSVLPRRPHVQLVALYGRVADTSMSRWLVPFLASRSWRAFLAPDACAPGFPEPA